MLAFGFPAGSSPGEDASSTRGVVSAASTFFRDPAPDVPFYPEAIRTDTALDPGFSGGPLVDLDRNVIGVNAAARATGDDGRPLQGANYAIAADRARRVLDDLRRGRSRAWIGANFGYPTREELAAAAPARGARSCSARWRARPPPWRGSAARASCSRPSTGTPSGGRCRVGAPRRAGSRADSARGSRCATRTGG